VGTVKSSCQAVILSFTAFDRKSTNVLLGITVKSAIRLGASAGAAFAILSISSLAIAQSRAQIHSTTLPEIAAIEAAKAKRTPAQQKMCNHLVDAINKSRTGVAVAGAPNLIVGNYPTLGGDPIVDISGTISPELVTAVQAAGAPYMKQHPASIHAVIPLDGLESIAARDDVSFVFCADVSGRRAAARAQAGVAQKGVAQEGVTAHIASEAWKSGFKGKGVKVGVISDTIYNPIRPDTNAFAPGGPLDKDKVHVTVIKDEDGVEQTGLGIGEHETGEGLAMLEIIHAIAPDAELYFATGNGGQAQIASNISTLADKYGCNIIVDDFMLSNESPFQPGTIGKAIDHVSSQGVLYFSAAGNSGSKKYKTAGTWEGDFLDGGQAPEEYGLGQNARLHVFDSRHTFNTIDTLDDTDVTVNLFWSDAPKDGENGYDLYRVKGNNGDKRHIGHVIDNSTDDVSKQDPFQSIRGVKQGDSIVIVKVGAKSRFLHLDLYGGGRAILRYGTSGGVRGHSATDAANAFSVAAIGVPKNPTAAFKNGAKVEWFSSDGPRRVFYDATGAPITPGNLSSNGGKKLHKPDLAAADGVSTTLPKGPLHLNPFIGTSAAAAHAAAIAALVLSCSPRPNPAEVRQALEHTALPTDGKTPNYNAGYGIAMAAASVQSIMKATGCRGAPNTGP
jgi:hypothetical protein